MERHGRCACKVSALILVNFCAALETFFILHGFHRQANTRPAGRPPSDLPVPLKGVNGRARDDLARLSRNFYESVSQFTLFATPISPSVLVTLRIRPIALVSPLGFVKLRTSLF